MRIRLLVSLFSIALLFGCSSESDPAADTGTDVNRPTGGRDTGGRVEDIDETPVEDVDTPPPPRDVVIDHDPNPIDCEVRGTECVASSIFCLEDSNTVAFCSRCGEILREEACDEMSVCDVIDGAGRCRPCEGSECPIMDACEANARTCHDFDTVEICGADGRIGSLSDCPAGRRCFDGNCGFEGATTGATCSQNLGAADGCTGMNCICGTEFRDTPAGNAFCQSNSQLQAGYCSTGNCEANGCDFGSETCATFDLNGSAGGGSYCIRNEGCSRRGASCGGRAGLSCVELPGRRSPGGPIQWDWACWAPTNTIGDSCSSNADCAGGMCRNKGGVSYCVSACGSDADCPSHAACVEDPAGPGHVCLAKASDCPRITSEPFNIKQSPMNRYGIGSVAVCYFTN